MTSTASPPLDIVRQLFWTLSASFLWKGDSLFDCLKRFLLAIRTVAKGCPPLLTLIGIDFHCFAPPRYCQAASKPCQAALLNVIRLLSEALKSAFHCSKKGSCWQLELSQGCLPLWTLIGIDFHCFATHQNLFSWDEPALPSYSDIIRLLSTQLLPRCHCPCRKNVQTPVKRPE